jgi:hypothetical protein
VTDPQTNLHRRRKVWLYSPISLELWLQGLESINSVSLALQGTVTREKTYRSREAVTCFIERLRKDLQTLLPKRQLTQKPRICNLVIKILLRERKVWKTKTCSPLSFHHPVHLGSSLVGSVLLNLRGKRWLLCVLSWQWHFAIHQRLSWPRLQWKSRGPDKCAGRRDFAHGQAFFGHNGSHHLNWNENTKLKRFSPYEAEANQSELWVRKRIKTACLCQEPQKERRKAVESLVVAWKALGLRRKKRSTYDEPTTVGVMRFQNSNMFIFFGIHFWWFWSQNRCKYLSWILLATPIRTS